MLFVPTMKVLTNWFRPDEFARMTGILMAVGGLGAYTASRPLAWLSDRIGWRTSFMVIGGATLGRGRCHLGAGAEYTSGNGIFV